MLGLAVMHPPHVKAWHWELEALLHSSQPVLYQSASQA
jgi:hypothetical protein